MEEQAKQAIDKKMEIKANIIQQYSNIKSLLDLGTPLMDKIEEFTEEDLSKAFDISSGIEEEAEKIIRLLFDLRDLIERQRLQSKPSE